MAHLFVHQTLAKPVSCTRTKPKRLFSFYLLAIRNWVLIPIMLVMVLVGIVRHYVTVLLNGTPKKADLKSARET